MRSRAALAAALIVTGVALVWSPAASADPPAALGWWTQRPGALPLAGAIELATSVRGVESVAAVRITGLADGADAVRLVLSPTATPAAGTAAIEACPAGQAWEPADAGAFDEQPAADCATSIAATPVGLGRYAVELGPLVRDGTIDVVLLPVAEEVIPGLGASIGFTATFTVDVVVGGAAAGGTTTTTATTVPAAATDGNAGASPAAPRPAPRATPRPAAPTTPRPAPLPASTPATIAAGGSIAGPSGPGATIPTPMFDQTRQTDDRPWGRLLLLVPLSAAAGIGSAAARNAARRRGADAVAHLPA